MLTIHPLFRFTFILCLFFSQYAEATSLTKAVQIGSENSTHPSLAVDQKGNAVAVWVYQDGKHSYIHAATQPMHKDWSKPYRLSHSDKKASYPKVVVDDKGNAVAVWLEADGDKVSVHAATLPSGAKDQWVHAKDPLSGDVSEWSAPHVGVDKKGSAIAIWSSYKDDKSFIQGAKLPFGDKKWISLPENEQPYVDDYRLAVDREGNAIVVWMDFHDGHAVMAATLRHDSKSWSPAQKLNDPNNADDQALAPYLAIDHEGNAVAVWLSNTPNHGLKAALLPFKAKDWIATEFPPCSDPVAPALAFDAAGTAMVVWRTSMSDPESGSILCASLPRLGKTSWTAPITINIVKYHGGDGYPNIATDRKGNAMVVWGNLCTEHHGPLFARTFKAGVWDPTLPYILCFANTGTDPLEQPVVGLSNKGSAVILYSCPGTDNPKANTLNAVGGFGFFQKSQTIK